MRFFILAVAIALTPRQSDTSSIHNALSTHESRVSDGLREIDPTYEAIACSLLSASRREFPSVSNPSETVQFSVSVSY